jgi:peptidoglycan hydrolase-like amidase
MPPGLEQQLRALDQAVKDWEGEKLWRNNPSKQVMMTPTSTSSHFDFFNWYRKFIPYDVVQSKTQCNTDSSQRDVLTGISFKTKPSADFVSTSQSLKFYVSGATSSLELTAIRSFCRETCKSSWADVRLSIATTKPYLNIYQKGRPATI